MKSCKSTTKPQRNTLLPVTAYVVALLLLCAPTSWAAAGVTFSGIQSSVGVSSSWSGPVGVAADDSGNLYVASYRGWYISKVVLATGQTTRITNFNVQYPQDMKIYGGNLYIASQGENYIKVYSLATQQLVNTLYCPGIFALTIDSSGNIYAGLDAGNASKIEVFLNGSTTPTVIKSSGLTSMTGLAITPSGQLYAADTGANTIYKIDTTNNYALTTVPIHVTQPRGLVFDSVGRLYVAAAGTPGQSNGYVLRYPAGSYTDASGAILAQNLNYEEEVTIASTGDAYVTSYLGNLVTKISPHADFGTTVPVGSSATQTLSYTVNAGTTIGAWHANNDQSDSGQFSLVGNSCGTGVFVSTTTCTATLQFAPLQAASTHAWIDVLDASNNVLSTVFTSGVGLAPRIGFNPTSSQALAPGIGSVYGIAPLPNQHAAIASASTLYAGDPAATPTLLASGLVNPSELAIDGKQNLFIADTGNQRVATIPVFTDPTNPTTLSPAGALTTFSTSTANFTGVAVDGSGSVYYADATNGRIFRRDWTDTGYGPEVAVATGITNPGAIAVDSSRNLFVLSGATVLELPWTGQGYGNASVITSQLTTPSAISVDGAGNLYVSDSQEAHLVEIPFTGTGYGAQFTLLSNITDARQALIESSGTLYVLGGSTGTITAADRIQNLQLAFPSTSLQTTSAAGPLSVQMQNIGTASATFAALGGGNPYLSSNSFIFNTGSSTCPVSTSSTSLAPGATCTLAIDYMPQSLSATSGSLTFNDNALNMTGSTQTVALSGIVATSPTQVVLSSLPTQLTSGSNLGTATVSVEDAYGNVVTNSTATVTATITGPNGYTQILTASAANGVATLNLSSLSLNQAGMYTVTASSSGLTGASTTVNVSAGPAVQLSASSVPSSVVSGGNLGTETVTVQDAYGNTVTSSSAAVTATITGPNGYSQTMSANAVNGVATLNLSTLGLNAAGNYTVTTGGSGVTGTSSTVAVTAGPASQLITSAVAPTVVSGGNLGTVTTTLQDAHGNTVTSSTATVSATITGPNGYSQTVTANAANGVATLNLSTLPLNAAGSYTVTTSSNGVTGTSSNVTVTPGPASQLSSSPLPSSVLSSGNLGTLTVTVQDANGNTVTNSTATVSATITGPNGYSQTVTANAANGVATLNLSTLPLNAAGSYTVTTSSNGVTGTSSNVTVTPGPASQLSSSTLPPSVLSGGNLGMVAVTIQDANGNTETNSIAAVTATVTGPNGYSQSISANAVNGVATLNLSTLNLSAAGNYTVTTSSNGVTGTSAAVTVNPGSASLLSASAPPSTIVSGGNLGTVAVSVQDANHNTVSNSTATVTATITGPNGFSQTVIASAVNGVATLNLSSFTLNTAGSYTVTTSGNGLTGTSSAIVVTPGPAVQLSTSGAPTSVMSGGNLGVITATVQDANSNAVTSSTATVTATIVGPNGYSQTISANAVNGVATLNLGSLNLRAAGNYTIVTSSNGVTNSTSTVTVAPAAATQVVSTSVAASLTSGGNLGVITASVQDANGNTVTTSNAIVTATVTGPNNYSQTISVNAVNGVASLNLSSLNLTTAGAYTVSSSSNGLAPSNSAVTVNPGAASQVALGSVPATLTAGQNLGTITATVRDANGNVVTNSSAPISATLTGPNGFMQTVTATAVNGVTTLDLSSLRPAAAGTYTLSLGGMGLATASSTLTVGAATQTITLPNLPNLTYGAGAVALPATSSAGLPITYALTGPATLNGTTLIVTGAGTVTVTATQAGDAGHNPVTVTGSFTAAKAPSSTTLSSTSSVAVSGASVTLTAQVVSSAGTPTGVVTFLSGTTVVGQSTLTKTGSAALTLTTLPTGPLNLTASYSGDANFLASLSTSSNATVQDFGIAPVTASTTPVVPGASTSFTLSLVPGIGGFSSAITLTASGLPPGATYSFLPATVTPGSSTVNTVLTVQTMKSVATARHLGSVAGVTLALLLLPFSVSRRTRASIQSTRVLSVAGLLILFGSMTALTGCGSSNGFFAQQQKTYTVTVTATSGSLSHTTTVVVDVQ